MNQAVTINVPNIGEAENVEVIEILVAVGDRVEVEDPLITLESDKASMEIPALITGIVREIFIAVGDHVSEGDLVLSVDADQTSPAGEQTHSVDEPAIKTGAAPEHTEVLVIGAGPGGYTAAFRAADLGKKVTLIERHSTLGGVCLNVGCIPSKALLHVAHVIEEASALAKSGITFGKPEIDLAALRKHKEKIVQQLTGGLAGLAKQRKVTVINGDAKFTSANTVEVNHDGQQRNLGFEHAIIAAGSHSVKIPGFPYDDPRMLDSTSALALKEIPKRMLVIGGGIIGLEMASVYTALGASVTVVELADVLIPGCDPDLVRPLKKRISQSYENIYLQSKVTRVEPEEAGLRIWFEGKKTPENDLFDQVLLAVGRQPNSGSLDADAAGIAIDERGFIPVDRQMRTNVTNIFAIGDIVGQPMLAHKATHEGKVAAEVIAGHPVFFDAKTIPSVAYTDPEIAWMGLTESTAKADDIKYEKAIFPWAASGRSLSIGRNEGMTKVIFDPDSKQLLGAGIVGSNAGELIAEAVLALEMGADMEDLALTIHPHPTLSETLNFAAEVAEGTVTDLYVSKK